MTWTAADGDVPRPGQFVAYPILQIAGVFPMAGEPGHGDVVAHLRAMEEALIATVAAHDVVAVRRPPYTGIWVGGQKLAAIGVKLASGVTTHGAALNVTTDLAWFDEVIPCGIEGAGVASLASLGVRPAPRLHDVAVRFATELARVAIASRSARGTRCGLRWRRRRLSRLTSVRWRSHRRGDLSPDDQSLANWPAQTHKPLVKAD